MRVYRLIAKPCVHEIGGFRHPSRADLLACIDRHGVPGFEIREFVDPRRQGKRT